MEQIKFFKAFKVISKSRLVISIVLTSLVGFIATYKEPFEWHKLFILMFALTLLGFAAAIINNLLDHFQDEKMDRTRDRKEVIDFLGKEFLWGFSIILFLVSSGISFLVFGYLIFFLFMIAFFSYVIWYTIFLKRKNPFGVVLGGLPGALPILIGHIAANMEIFLEGWLLFAFMMLWQPPHFWVLSLKIKGEYQNANIPVLPNVYGIQITKYFVYIYAFSLIPISLFFSLVVHLKIWSMIGIFIAGVYYLLITMNALEKEKNYQRAFKASLVYMLSFMVLILIDRLYIRI